MHGTPPYARGGDRQGGRAPGRGDDLADLLKPPPQRIDYFVPTKDGGTAIDRRLLDERARTVAEQLLGKIKKTQLRRFYSPVVALRDRAVAGRVADEDLQAELALLKARVAYAHKRSGVTVPAPLVRLFTDHAFSVTTRADFLAFARHFEAVVAYHHALSGEGADGDDR